METKKTKFNISVLYYILSGIILGSLITFSYMSRLSKETVSTFSCPTISVQEIDTSEARVLRNNYIAARSGQNIVQGINISKNQWKLINSSFKEAENKMEEISGISLYYGSPEINPDAPLFCIAYPLNNEERPKPIFENVNFISMTKRIYSDPCPHFCD